MIERSQKEYENYLAGRKKGAELAKLALKYWNEKAGAPKESSNGI